MNKRRYWVYINATETNLKNIQSIFRRKYTINVQLFDVFELSILPFDKGFSA